MDSLYSGYENKSLPGLSLICMCCTLLESDCFTYKNYVGL